VRPGVDDAGGESFVEAALEGGFPSVIAAGAYGVLAFEIAEVGEGRDASGDSVDEGGLVEIGEHVEVSQDGSYVVGVEKELSGQLALEAEAPLLDHGRGGGGIDGANLCELVVDVVGVKIVGGETVLKKEDGRGGSGSHGGVVVDEEGRVEGHLVFAAEALEESVEDAVSAADDSLLVGSVAKAEARSEVLCIGLDERTVLDRAAGGKVKSAAASVAGGVEVGDVVLSFEGGRGEVVAEAEVEGEVGEELEVVLEEGGVHLHALVYVIDIGEHGAADVAEKSVGIGEAGAVDALLIAAALAGEDVAEVDVAPRVRLVLEDVTHGSPEIDADLDEVAAAYEGERVDVLELLRRLRLGQEVGRADEGVVLEGDVGEAAVNGWILRDSGNVVAGVADAKGNLLGVGGAANEAEAEIVGEGWAEDVCPAEDGAVGFEFLVAPGGGVRSVGDAVEGAGHDAVAVGEGVASEDGVVLRGSPVDAAVVVVVEVGERCGAGVVVLLPRLVGQWEEIEDLRRVGIDAARWDGIVLERLAGGDVVDGGIADADGLTGGWAEVADALVGQGHGGEAGYSAMDARSLIVDESEEAVVEDGRSKVAAELVLDVFGPLETSLVGDVVVGVEDAVSEIFEEQAVEFVGATLGGDVDSCAGAASVFRGVGVGDDFEFLNGVDGGAGGFGGELLDVFGEGVVVDAVEDEVVLQGVDAVDIEAAGAACSGLPALLGVAIGLHAGDEAEEIVPGAEVERRVLNGHVVDDGADGGVFAGELHGLRFDGDSLAGGADGELEVEAAFFRGVQRDALRGALES